MTRGGPIGDFGSGDTTTVNLVPFGASGQATLTGAALTNSNFNGTTVSLLNSGGTVAKQAQVNLSYSSTYPQQGTDTVTGSR